MHEPHTMLKCYHSVVVVFSALTDTVTHIASALMFELELATCICVVQFVIHRDTTFLTFVRRVFCGPIDGCNEVNRSPLN